MKKLLLYNEEYERHTTEASQLDKEVTPFIREIFKKYIKLGFKIREISHILVNNIIVTECEEVLTMAVKKRKMERNK
ncbi:MAG: hypothetical protein V1663_04035 [archaeon]